MKPQTLIMLVVALGCGLVALVLTNQMLKSKSEEQITGDRVQVVLAEREIPRGTMITDGMVREERIPKNLLPERYFDQKKPMVGRVAHSDIRKNEVITEYKVAKEGITNSMEAVIKPGMRAMTVKISTDRTAAGFIKPGSRVDALHVAQVRAMGSRASYTYTRSKIILFNVEVLAVNSEMTQGSDPTASGKGKMVDMVTLLLTPLQTEKLALAKKTGEVDLALRQTGDTEEIKTQGIASVVELDKPERELEERNLATPESIVINEDQVEKKKNLAQQLQEIFNPKAKEEPAKDAKEGDKPDEPAPDVAPDSTNPTQPAKPKVLLVIRDLPGNPLMTVVLDADSKLAKALKDHVVEFKEGAADTAQEEAAPNPMTVHPPAAGGEKKDAKAQNEDSPSAD